MPKFERHVFVCVNEREPGHHRGCCYAKDGPAVRQALKSAVERLGLQSKVRINKSGCLDQCEHGVTVVVYPEAVWYGGVTVADCDELFNEHVLNGRPVERLRIESMRPAPENER